MKYDFCYIFIIKKNNFRWTKKKNLLTWSNSISKQGWQLSCEILSSKMFCLQRFFPFMRKTFRKLLYNFLISRTFCEWVTIQCASDYLKCLVFFRQASMREFFVRCRNRKYLRNAFFKPLFLYLSVAIIFNKSTSGLNPFEQTNEYLPESLHKAGRQNESKLNYVYVWR